jgi:cytoskeletal protein CcmA (bactofilin family)
MESETLWAALLFAAFALLSGIPLLPAIEEWHARRDVRALRVVRDYDGNVRFFARSFATFVDLHFGEAILQCRREGSARDGVLPDGEPYHIAPPSGSLLIQEDEHRTRRVHRVVVGAGPLLLPDELLFELEIFGHASIRGGRRGVYRALLSRGHIALAEASAVLRWAHAEGSFLAAGANLLYGRVSAERSIALGARTCFTRLHAPVIRFGGGAKQPTRSLALSHLAPQTLPGVFDTRGGRILVRGDIEIPAGARIEGAMVAAGRVRIGRGAWVSGNVKSGRGVYVEPGACVDGALVSGGAVHIAGSSWMKGPIVAERHISVGGNCHLGSPGQPTTVSAEAILVAPGVTAYGTVWARVVGRVRDT